MTSLYKLFDDLKVAHEAFTHALNRIGEEFHVYHYFVIILKILEVYILGIRGTRYFIILLLVIK